ncbi:hypothetical protein ACLOJK_008409 [Asimina triloba]
MKGRNGVGVHTGLGGELRESVEEVDELLPGEHPRRLQLLAVVALARANSRGRHASSEEISCGGCSSGSSRKLSVSAFYHLLFSPLYSSQMPRAGEKAKAF